jgi:hypothetical protein
MSIKQKTKTKIVNNINDYKLICKGKDGVFCCNKCFTGTFKELNDEINKINSGNYSYNIIDFEKIN